MNFLNRLLNKTCSHQFLWPRIDADGRHYQRCSQCGIAYEYDWNKMQLTGRMIAPTTLYHSEAVAALKTFELRVQAGR
jgi:hypothetical protein